MPYKKQSSLVGRLAEDWYKTICSVVYVWVWISIQKSSFFLLDSGEWIDWYCDVCGRQFEALSEESLKPSASFCSQHCGGGHLLSISASDVRPMAAVLLPILGTRSEQDSLLGKMLPIPWPHPLSGPSCHLALAEHLNDIDKSIVMMLLWPTQGLPNLSKCWNTRTSWFLW